VPRLVPPVVPAGTLAARPQPTIEVADGIVLRSWTEADAPAVLAAYSDPDIQRWGRRAIETLDEAREWIATWDETWLAETHASWAIARRTPDEVVGRVSLRGIDLLDGEAECGYWTLPAGRGQGLAPLGLEALCRWGFEEIGFHRLTVCHSVQNEASCRVAVKAGFALEGTMRQNLFHSDGWHDMHLHGRMRDDPVA
jgi:RimJ/RimL family protein N-acetyltransferase